MRRTGSILTVDDDSSLFQAAHRALAPLGYTLLEADSGDEVLQLVRARRPDVVLLDAALPGLDGARVCQQIKTDPQLAGVYVIMVTDPGDDLTIGADDYIIRSFDDRELVVRVEAVLRIKAAEDALRARDARWQSSFDAIFDPAALLSADGAIEQCNQAFAILFERDGETVVGQTCCRQIHPTGDQASDCLIDRARRSGGRETAELVVGNRAFFATIDPVRTPDGQISGFVHVLQDMTGYRWIEEALRESYQNLAVTQAELEETRQCLVQQERLATVGQLTAGMAHDFNNIVTTIMFYAQIALSDPDQLSSAQARAFETILNESCRAGNLVRQVLDFNRFSKLDIRPTDLESLVQEVVNVLEPILPENIRLFLNVEPEEFVIPADPARIEQVITNLALNARDAMSEGGGDLYVGLSKQSPRIEGNPAGVELPQGEWVCLSVTDTGTGMSPEVRQHLFEPFFTTKRRGKGTGLGLVQVYGIVKQHGGHVGVQTEVGHGTTFRVYLPSHNGAKRLDGVMAGPVAIAPSCIEW